MFVVFPKALSGAEINEHATQANAVAAGNGALIACSFDKGDARDESGHNIAGVLSGVEVGKGKTGLALWFKKAADAPATTRPAGLALAPAKNDGSFVQDRWTRHVPVVTRAMAMAGRMLFIAGPPDNLDEEYAFERLAAKDPTINEQLNEQDASLDGKRGGRLSGINADTGNTGQELDMDSPPVWDGMVAAQGRLFAALVNGKVVCFGVPQP